MKAIFTPCKLHGSIQAPPSKSMAHRYLIGAAISGQKCTLGGFAFSQDILATIDCLRALGVTITCMGNVVTVEPNCFMKVENPVLECRESGSTLRFFIPLALCMGKRVKFIGSERLLERPLGIYETLCVDNGFVFEKDKNSLTVCGKLRGGDYKIKGNVSSQFITGLIFALVYLNEESTIEIIPPFESRSYIDLTLSALKSFGASVEFSDEYVISIKKSKMHDYMGKIEGDYSNSAFLDVFNHIGSNVKVEKLNENSEQGDKVYSDYFKHITKGSPTLDISNCHDLAPVLFALSALKNGATFTGTDRLKIKESDRGQAMHEQLRRLGGGLEFRNNQIIVPKQELAFYGQTLDGCNDHRIVMACSVILTRTGGEIEGVEAVNKSYPNFFEDIKKLGAKVELV